MKQLKVRLKSDYSFVEITEYDEINVLGIDLCIHKDKDDGKWVVTEPQTGFYIVKGYETRAEALAKAREEIKTRGVPEVERRIKGWLKEINK